MTQDDVEHVHVVFELQQDDDGWPPLGSERMWAVPVAPDRVRLENIPFFARSVALGDVVRTETDADGVLWAAEVVEVSGNCTIRVIPEGSGPMAADRRAVLDAFEPLGAEGEGIEQYGIVALNVPPTANLAAVRGLLLRGEAEGWWDYEEGSITEEWACL